MPVLFSDRCPIANPQRGVIRITLRATSTKGGALDAGELALTPGAASMMVAVLLQALREFQTRELSSVVAFPPTMTDELPT